MDERPAEMDDDIRQGSTKSFDSRTGQFMTAMRGRTICAWCRSSSSAYYVTSKFVKDEPAFPICVPCISEAITDYLSPDRRRLQYFLDLCRRMFR